MLDDQKSMIFLLKSGVPQGSEKRERYGKDADLKENTTYFSGDTDEVIEEKEATRDLGVIMQSDGGFSDQIEKICSKVRQKSGWLFRTFYCRQGWFLRHMWNSLIQPHIDYCSQLWTPDDQESIKSIEGVQMNFISKVSGTENMNHWERLKFLKLNSQKRRSERYVVIFLWKIAEGLVKGYEVGFSELDNGRRGRTALPKPYIHTAPAAVKRARESSLSVKGCRLFNLLPPEVRSMSGCTVDTFKTAVDDFLEEIPDQPTIPGCQRAATRVAQYFQKL